MTENYMAQAIKMAHQAVKMGEVPVGAVIVNDKGEVITQTHNLCEIYGDPTAHAEMLAIKMACEQTKSQRLDNCDIYVTLEPCPMCAMALSHARIRRVYFGAYDPKSGGVDHGPQIYTHAAAHHKPEVIGGIQLKECGKILSDFFLKKR